MNPDAGRSTLEPAAVITKILENAFSLAQSESDCRALSLVLFAIEPSHLRVHSATSLDGINQLQIHTNAAGAILDLTILVEKVPLWSTELSNALCQSLDLRWPDTQPFGLPLISANDESIGVLIFHLALPMESIITSDRQIQRLINVATLTALALANDAEAVLHERRSIARQLHNTVCQSLYSVQAFVELTHHALLANREDALQHNQDALDSAKDAVEEIQAIVDDLNTLSV